MCGVVLPCTTCSSGAPTTMPSLSLRIHSLRPTQEVVTLYPKSPPAIQEDNNNINSHKTNHPPPRTATPITTVRPTCPICSINLSQYTCPRCHLPYCSAACYQEHGKESSSLSDDTDGNNSSNNRMGCTELFHEQRVSQILQLEVKERSGQFMKDMMRQQNEYQSHDSSSTQSTELCRRSTGGAMIRCNNDFSSATTSDSTIETMNREELIQLWSILEQFEDRTTTTTSSVADADAIGDDVTLLHEMVKQQCSIRTQTVVKQAMYNLTKRRDSSHNQTENETMNSCNVTDWMLEPWSPWWRPNLVPIAARHRQSELASEDDDDDDDDTSIIEDNDSSHLNGIGSSSNNVETTLYERLMVIPNFKMLHRRKEFPQLQYNLIDILFATVHTLRLYHGVNNILQQQQQQQSDDIVIDAAMTLTGTSLVLLRDQRYTTIESVLMECCNINLHPIYQQLKYGSSMSSITSTSDMTFLLLQDVALLYKNHRYVARALLEANDVLQQAIILLKVRNPKGTNKKNTAKTSTNDELRNHLRRIQKKIEFYLSWTMAVSYTTTFRKVSNHVVMKAWPYRHISTDLQIWIEGWQLPTTANSKQDRSIAMIV